MAHNNPLCDSPLSNAGEQGKCECYCCDVYFSGYDAGFRAGVEVAAAAAADRVTEFIRALKQEEN